MRNEDVANRSTAPGQKREALRGETGLKQHLGEFGGDCWRVTRWLYNNGVSGDQSCDRHANHNGEREVPRRNYDSDAKRQINHLVALTGELHDRLRSSKFQCVARVVFTEVNGL